MQKVKNIGQIIIKIYIFIFLQRKKIDFKKINKLIKKRDNKNIENINIINSNIKIKKQKLNIDNNYNNENNPLIAYIKNKYIKVKIVSNKLIYNNIKTKKINIDKNYSNKNNSLIAYIKNNYIKVKIVSNKFKYNNNDFELINKKESLVITKE